MSGKRTPANAPRTGLFERLRRWVDPASETDVSGSRSGEHSGDGEERSSSSSRKSTTSGDGEAQRASSNRNAPRSRDDGERKRPAPDGGAADVDTDADATAFDVEDGDDADGPTVDDLDHRIDELEARVDRQSASIDGVRSSQAELADRVDGMDDRTRRLLGVYDRLTDDVNPLTDDSHARENGSDPESAANAEWAEYRFGVVAGPPSADAGGDPGAAVTESAAETGVERGGVESEGDGVVTVDDLGGPDAVGSDGAPDAGGESPPPSSGRVGIAGADGYAMDLVVFEWLTTLICAAGPAGALRAIRQYERIGWIDADLRSHLEAVLGGPALDADVDPTEPGELAVADHERSYEYVRRLAVLRRLGAGGDGGNE